MTEAAYSESIWMRMVQFFNCSCSPQNTVPYRVRIADKCTFLIPYYWVAELSVTIDSRLETSLSSVCIAPVTKLLAGCLIATETSTFTQPQTGIISPGYVLRASVKGTSWMTISSFTSFGNVSCSITAVNGPESTNSKVPLCIARDMKTGSDCGLLMVFNGQRCVCLL